MKLLLVEDDPDSAEAMTIFLRLEGHEVEWACTGGGALASLSAPRSGDRGAPDVILLDLTLPDMSGVALAEEMRRTLAAVPPIVLLSARTEQQLDAAARSIQPAQVVRKPFELPKLIEAIRAAARQPH